MAIQKYTYNKLISYFKPWGCGYFVVQRVMISLRVATIGWLTLGKNLLLHNDFGSALAE